MQALGREEPLYTTSRLDGCTEGVLVLGKTPAFVAAFNLLLRGDGAVQKRYRALSTRPPPLGQCAASLRSLHCRFEEGFIIRIYG